MMKPIDRLRRFAHRRRVAAALALWFVAPACTPADGLQAPASQGQATVFAGANVIPMDTERVLENHTVVVRGGRIEQVGPAAQLAVPEGALVVDARGKYLMPGLAEMHAHIPAASGGMDGVVNTLFLYVAGGVTTIRGMQGNPLHLELRDQVARHELVGPRIYAAGPGLNANSAPNPEAAVRMVEEQKQAGYDLLKLLPGLTRATFDAMAAAAHRMGIPFAGHVPANVGLNRALEARYASIDHLDGYVEALAGYPGGNAPNPGFFGFNLLDRLDESRIPALAAATRESGVWNVPTQTLIEHLASTEDPRVMAQWPEMRYMSPQTVNQWIQRKEAFRQDAAFTPERAARFIDVRRRLLKALHDAGAEIALGSDAPQWWNVPGFSVRRELYAMVAAGLTPYEALATGTRHAARYFDAGSEWGTVAQGLTADLILLEANPLTDIENLWKQEGVMVRGNWLPRQEIDRRLGDIAAAQQP
jgi:imidazolonepropionase-like amidohydrolase